MLHHVGPSADRADREAASDHLAEAGDVGRDVVLLLGTTR